MLPRTAQLLTLLALAGGCRKEAPPAAPAPTPVVPRRVPATGTNHVDVTVTLAGKPPEMAPAKRDADPFCAKTPMKDEEVIVTYGDRLSNVLVRLTKGVTGTFPAPAFDATLDQADCMYRPRVLGMMAGQSLVIRSSDPTAHNVHAYRGASTILNQGQIPGQPPLRKVFKDAAGEILKFRCDAHPWMTAYVAVLNHPFFAVTGQGGNIRLLDVPLGKYTLEAWHERYGTQSQEITVGPGAPVTAAFQFRAAN